jgi:hypothetical protein
MKRKQILSETDLDALLRVAANFDPATQAPEGLAHRALTGVGRRPVRRRLVLAGATAMTIALIALVSTRLPRIAAIRETTGPGRIRMRPISPPVRYVDTGSASVDTLVRTVTPQRAVDDAGKAREPLVRHARRKDAQRIARVRLREEVVRRYDTGVLAPVWVAERNSDGDGVVMQPAVVQVPLQDRFVSHAGLAAHAPDRLMVMPVDHSR